MQVKTDENQDKTIIKRRARVCWTTVTRTTFAESTKNYILIHDPILLNLSKFLRS